MRFRFLNLWINQKHKNLDIFRGWLYERNWFIFGSPRCSKNEPGLKIFFYIMTKKCIWSVSKLKANQKYSLLSFFLKPKGQFYNCVFQNTLIFKYFHAVLVWPWTAVIIWVFQYVFGSLMAHLGSAPFYIGEPVGNHII